MHRFEKITEKSKINELQSDDWLFFQEIYGQADISLNLQLCQSIAQYTGIQQQKIDSSLKLLSSESTPPAIRNDILLSLDSLQKAQTQKILNLQKKSALQAINYDVLNVTRSEWLLIIDKIEQNERKKTTPVFFLLCISTIRKVSYESLSEQITKKQLPRKTKELILPKEKRPFKRKFKFFELDTTKNPLILESNNQTTPLEEKIIQLGVRCVTLEPATPERNYKIVKKTPKGSKVRPFCTIGNKSLFQPLSPYSNNLTREGTIDLSQSSDLKKSKLLPKVLFAKLDSIEFTATLERMLERSGKSRKISQQSLMKISSSNVFRAHGVIISAKEGHHFHWMHLIAYFLGGPQDSINLVPSTAAANYNTLETIELFIKEKLVNNEAKQIHIKVTPHYSHQQLIPGMLEYTLNWNSVNKSGLTQAHHEIFYINPLSYQRINQPIQASIKVLRDNEQNPLMASSAHKGEQLDTMKL